MGDIKTVILCGGKGLRFRGYSSDIPKPLAIIGKYPIVIHIMKLYSSYGYNKFILCLGYLENKFEEFFEYNKTILDENNWTVELIETGEDTETGSRIKRIQNYIDTPSFMVTYGDGVSDVDINQLYKHHIKHDKIGTVTLVKPRSNFGIIKINKNNIITSFIEKPFYKDWINGGFFVFKTDFFDYLEENNCILEKDALPKLAHISELTGFKHRGFWSCMDTYKDYLNLNKMYSNNNFSQ